MIGLTSLARLKLKLWVVKPIWSCQMCRSVRGGYEVVLLPCKGDIARDVLDPIAGGDLQGEVW